MSDSQQSHDLSTEAGVPGRKGDVDTAVAAAFRQGVEDGIGADVAMEAEYAVECVERHPRLTAEVLYGSARVVGAAHRTLQDEWAVYGPRDAGAAVAAVRELTAETQRLARTLLAGITTAQSRGDIPDTPRIAQALGGAAAAVDRAEGAGAREYAELFGALDEAVPQGADRAPATVHDTIVAVAARLGAAATVDTTHHGAPDAGGTEDDEVLCGCVLAYTTAERQTWHVSWNDEWGAVLDEGGRTEAYVLTEGVDFFELGISEPLVHPAHLAAAILRTVPGARAAT
ncbi:hypothetical protein [Streptomyces sp. NPDC002825]|uniref:hypothetical protein n=1 Tax=Streptomyces sp. NPDC002825 TaxID=3154666 RepID=UPI0033282857